MTRSKTDDKNFEYRVEEIPQPIDGETLANAQRLIRPNRGHKVKSVSFLFSNPPIMVPWKRWFYKDSFILLKKIVFYPSM